jgi:hypothetical protein
MVGNSSFEIDRIGARRPRGEIKAAAGGGAIGAIAGDARKGAAIGATVGAMARRANSG